MGLLSQYGDRQLISDVEPKTFRGRDAATGRAVLLHQLNSNPGSGRQLRLLAHVLRYTSSLPPGSASPILGIEEEGDSVWVITEDRPELANLWTWMESQAGKKDQQARGPSAPAGDAVPAPLAQSAQSPAALDEKTVLFATRLAAADALPVVDLDGPQARRTADPHADPEAAQTARFQAPVSTAPVSTAPGEVTRFFSGGLTGAPSDSNAATRPMIPSLSRTENSDATVQLPAPDASTRGVADAPSQHSSPSSSRSETTEASDTTVILARPGAPKQEPILPGPSASPSAPADSGPAPGEFTMLFRRTPASSAAGEQKPRFMGFTAPTQDKARYIDPPAPAREPLASSPPQPPYAPPEERAPESTAMLNVPGPAPPRADELPPFPGPSQEWGSRNAAEPGEFTQVFQRDQPPGEASVSSGQQREPGAFTRIFQIPVGSDLLTELKSEGSASVPAAEPHLPPSAPAGAWSPEIPGAAPPSTPAVPQFPDLASAMKLPGGAGVPATPMAPPPRPSALRPSPPAMPKLEPPKIPAAAPKMPAIPKAPKLPEGAVPESGPSILPLILIFGGIALVAVLVVLFFITKH